MKNHDLDAPVSALRRKLLLGLPGGLAVTAPLALVSCGGGDGTDTPSTPASVDRAEIEAIVAKLPAVERSAARVGVTLPAGSGVTLAETSATAAAATSRSPTSRTAPPARSTAGPSGSASAARSAASAW